MSVLYMLTSPSPRLAGTDAVFQEVAALRAALPGEIVNLSPAARSTVRIPKQLFGFHNIRQIKDMESRCSIGHVFFPFLYPFPILRLLRNPIIYTVTASLDEKRVPPARAQLRKLRRIVVSNERDAAVLQVWGLTNYAVVLPGVDTKRLVPGNLELDRELVLLMASAPWNARQFESKGIDLLLAAASRLPFLRLILLWRGVLGDELARRVRRLDLGARVEIVNRFVEIKDYLQRAHATIVLASEGGLVRSFPHSLIESLMAAKPILLSRTIAMADYVSSHRLGVVVPDMTIEALISSIERLRRGYAELARNTSRIERNAFSVDAMVENHRRLYGL